MGADQILSCLTNTTTIQVLTAPSPPLLLQAPDASLLFDKHQHHPRPPSFLIPFQAPDAYSHAALSHAKTHTYVQHPVPLKGENSESTAMPWG